ncbi:MAG TPA: hypothetical protein VNO30_47750 [Kofleriaceae bacterium]|nr:hypothetical protein [Kofleriaceae bacterium]
MKLQNVCSPLRASLLLLAAAAVTAPAARAEPPAEAAAEPAAEAPADAPAKTAAASDRVPAAQAPAAADPRVAFGFNLPIGWMRNTIAGSLYVGLHRHHAVRANFAWTNAEELLPLVATGFLSSPREGRILDAGIGWVYFPRRLWDGFMFEAGALLRDRDVTTFGEDDTSTVDSRTFAGYATVGWSWRLNQNVFIAAAVGLSFGHETGRETIMNEDFPREPMPRVVPLDRDQVMPEFSLRFGIAFGR